MKKLLAITLSLAVFLLSGCGGNSGNAGGSQDGTSAEPTSGGTAVLQTYGDVMSFCPDLTADDNFYLAAQNIYNRLAKLDAG